MEGYGVRRVGWAGRWVMRLQGEGRLPATGMRRFGKGTVLKVGG